MFSETFENRFSKLSKSKQIEIYRFIDFLYNQNEKHSRQKAFEFSWEGGLSYLKEKFDSVDLQHKAVEWR